MNKERDLLPWILGGLSVAAVAAAIVASSGRPVTPDLPHASAVAPQVLAPVSHPLPATAPEAPRVAEATAVPDAAASLPTAQTSPATEPAAQTGQIWECTTNGVKTFSNNPCGEKSTLLEVRPINTMSPPAVRSAQAYGREPRYAPPYADPNAYGDPNAYAGQDTYAEQGNADYNGTSYAVVQGFAFRPRRRPEHPHQPDSHHHSGPVARRN